jgi:hypothetical protein
LQIGFPGTIVPSTGMPHWYRYLLLYLWVAPHILLMVVAILLWVRRLHHNFPVFVLYVWYEIAEFVLLFTISVAGFNRGGWYTRVFLASMAISAALRFGVIQEIFTNVFREKGTLDALASTLLRWTTLLLVAGVVLFSIFAAGHSSNSMMAGAAWVARGVACVQCGQVLFLFLFSGFLGISLRSYLFGIAFGFGVLASVELINSALRVGDLSNSVSRALNLLPTGGYHIAVLLWIGYLIAPANKIVQPFEMSLATIKEWNLELRRLLL